MLETPQLADFRQVPSPPPATDERLNCRVLLVEDGKDNQLLVSRMLTKLGAEVAIADNGQIAVDVALRALAADEPFDVILMDMQMPVMDGVTATRTLRDKGYNRPIIALTAGANASDRDQCLRAGCDEFATKPLNRPKLIAIIRETLERSPAL